MVAIGLSRIEAKESLGVCDAITSGQETSLARPTNGGSTGHDI